MNATFHTPARAGSRAELREFIAENIVGALTHLEHGYDYAGLGSDAALGYALRSASAYLNAAVLTYADLASKGTCDG